MSGRRQDLKVNQLVDQYLKRSKELDLTLTDLESDLEAYNQRVQKRQLLEDKLVSLSDLITDAESSIDGLRESFNNANFMGDEHALTIIKQQRTSLLADIQQYKQEIADTKSELDSVFIDREGIALLAATLAAGVTIPHHAELVKTIELELKKLASAQQRKLTELRSATPANLADKATYDAKMKELNPRYKTDEERKQASERIQAARQAEQQELVRRLNQGSKSPSQIAARNRENERRAATPATEAEHQW